ncbi:MAG: 4'-phosphopantetheinyl transferase superfamily protein [Streptosporangiaceae bacterium]
MSAGPRAAVPAGTAEVWWARRQDAAPRHLALLDETERRRWTAYRHDADRERFLAGCALAKAVLARYAGLRPVDVRFDRTCGECGEPHGKPAMPGGSLEHSVAHSGDLVAVAVTGNPVGVDVEQLDGRAHPLGGDGDPEALARLVLSGAEQAVLNAIPPAGRARAFLVAWTRKEAVTKATGDGLRAAFSEVVVADRAAVDGAAGDGAAGDGAPRLASWPYPRDPRGVTLLDLDAAPGYLAALAVLGPCEAVTARDGSTLLAELV